MLTNLENLRMQYLERKRFNPTHSKTLEAYKQYLDAGGKYKDADLELLLAKNKEMRYNNDNEA